VNGFKMFSDDPAATNAFAPGRLYLIVAVVGIVVSDGTADRRGKP
jgi:hypothetical protein